MSLANLYYWDSIKKISDKGYIHSYIDHYYTHKFANLKEKPLVLLEIGIHYAQSIQLWRDWFKNGFIYCVDVDPVAVEKASIIPGVKSFNGDAFSKSVLDMFDDNFFDIIIEDGPHTLETQLFAVSNWSKKLKKNGTLIIEDIQSIDWIDPLIKAIPNEQGEYRHMYFDLRPVKNRYDDIILEITKN